MNIIPLSLKPFFQDVNFEALDPQRDSAVIIERTLSEGSVEENQWLFAQYGRDRITDWVRSRGADRLPKHRRALWHLLLGLPLPAERHSIWAH
jgi:hypothetical protein